MILEEQIEAIVIEKLGVDKQLVTPQASFYDDLGVDSLDVLELFNTIEKEFGLTIPDEDAERIKSVGALTNYIAAHEIKANHL